VASPRQSAFVIPPQSDGQLLRLGGSPKSGMETSVSSRKYAEGIWLKFYRAEAFSKQGGSCAYCGIRLRAYEATADHCKPVTLGGQTNGENIVMACQPCNLAKGQMSVRAFKRRLHNPAAEDSQLLWRAWSRWRLSDRTNRAEKRVQRWNKLR
jgi:5-methylcytosine-specific restriction endonuclease McrA